MFGGGEPAPEPELSPLEKRLKEENERKQAQKAEQKGGWPFG